MIREEKIEEIVELAEKAFDSHTKAIQIHLAVCFMVGQMASGMQAISVMELSKNEKRKKMIDLFDHICTGTSKAFPEASEFIDKLKKNCLKELEKEGFLR